MPATVLVLVVSGLEDSHRPEPIPYPVYAYSSSGAPLGRRVPFLTSSPTEPTRHVGPPVGVDQAPRTVEGLHRVRLVSPIVASLLPAVPSRLRQGGGGVWGGGGGLSGMRQERHVLSRGSPISTLRPTRAPGELSPGRPMDSADARLRVLQMHHPTRTVSHQGPPGGCPPGRSPIRARCGGDAVIGLPHRVMRRHQPIPSSANMHKFLGDLNHPPSKLHPL